MVVDLQNRTLDKAPIRFPWTGGFVNGSSRRLGQYIACALAKAGAALVLTSHDPQAFREFKSKMQAAIPSTIATMIFSL
jgi:hypothetical protein